METNATSLLVDADVHLIVPATAPLFPYLSDHWRAYIRESAFNGAYDVSYPRGTAVGGNVDGSKRGEKRVGLDSLRQDHLDENNISIAVLTCAYSIESIRNPYAAAAMASAVNDWQLHKWLSEEPRLRGSVVVPSQDPVLAAAEIDRIGQHDEFVQVHLPVHSEALYGNRHYYPILEAALRHNLAICIHFGGSPGNPPSAVGWPSHYVEEYVGMASIFQSQLISLVTSGAFANFPQLRVILAESGVSWLPSLMWRLDKEWKGLRREVPWVRRLPSEYIRERVRLATTPFDLPANEYSVTEIIEQIGSDEMLLFSSDFPHRHQESPVDDILRHFPEGARQKVAGENALSFFAIDRAPLDVDTKEPV